MNSEQWDARYRDARTNTDTGLWSTQAPRAITDVLSDLTPGTALDIATGDGRTALWLAANGWVTTAVDFSAEALRTARERADAHGLEVNWVRADLTSWRTADRFDVVTVAYLHLPRADNTSVLRAAASWVAPNGELIVLGHDIQNLDTGAPGPRDPELLYTPELLRDAVSEYLDILQCRTVIRDAASDAELPVGSPGQARDTFLRARRGPAASQL
ncbi:MAG: class I SAM-dependent methyltransferase [Microbacteriaceae bacterium]